MRKRRFRHQAGMTVKKNVILRNNMTKNPVNFFTGSFTSFRMTKPHHRTITFAFNEPERTK